MLKGLIYFASLAILGLCQSNDQYWHERYHGILSMAAYGRYDELCPAQTFTPAELQRKAPNSPYSHWEVIERFGPTASGLQGFTVIIPEMDKVVVVFRGLETWQSLSARPVDLNRVMGTSDCVGCTAHEGALRAYEEVRAATNNWAIANATVVRTGLQWSVTGHGFGGMVAQIMSLDLGWKGYLHWSHNHGSPRVFNQAAADRYNGLFQGEAGQRVVANNDIVPTLIPESSDYVFTRQGIHVFGVVNNASSSFNGHMGWTLCPFDQKDPTCAGGNSLADHGFYYTQIGSCGRLRLADTAAQAAFLTSSGFTSDVPGSYSNPAVNTTTTATSSSTSETTSTTTSASLSSTVTGFTTSTTSSGVSSTSTSTTSSNSDDYANDKTGAASSLFATGWGLLFCVFGFMLI